MKVPAKIEYAYKAVLELTLRYNRDNPIQLNTISESQRIPKKFLIQLFSRLKNAGIVNSSRGLAGGYYLAKPPSQISLADLFKAIDDSIIGRSEKSALARVSEADRLLRNILDGINKEITDRLEEITFDKLAARINKEQLTYNI